MKVPAACLVALAGSAQVAHSFVPVSGFGGATVSGAPTQQRSAAAVTMDAGRVPLMAGNWKMNPLDLSSAQSLAQQVAEDAAAFPGVEVAVIPPHPFLVPVKEKLSEAQSGVKLGAQNLYIEEKGAFTGAISTAMLKSVGCEYVLCGHSERRVVFGDSNQTINRKLRKVLDYSMNPILCIGESREEYEAGLNKEVCAVQMGKCLAGVTPEEMSTIVIAYEPVWAIGTGLTATPEIAQSVHAYIRLWLADKYGMEIANRVRIQYGGSVTPETVDELMACPDIDGALVGGASLVREKFSRIIGFKAPVSA